MNISSSVQIQLSSFDGFRVFVSNEKVLKQIKKKKKGRNRHNLNFGPETAFPGASKFEAFILLMLLVFELELFKPPVGFSAFGSETRFTILIAPKICSKNASYVPQLSSKFQVSTFSRFEVIAFSTSGC